MRLPKAARERERSGHGPGDRLPEVRCADVVSDTIAEAVISGVRTGKRGRGAADNVLVAIAVKQRARKGCGLARTTVTASRSTSQPP